MSGNILRNSPLVRYYTSKIVRENPSYLNFCEKFQTNDAKGLINNMKVYENFLSTDDETSLLQELEPYMKRLRYEYDHWDNVKINLFTSTTISNPCPFPRQFTVIAKRKD